MVVHQKGKLEVCNLGKRITIPDWLKDELDVRYIRDFSNIDKVEFYKKVVESGLVSRTGLSREDLEERKEEIGVD